MPAKDAMQDPSDKSKSDKEKKSQKDANLAKEQQIKRKRRKRRRKKKKRPEEKPEEIRIEEEFLAEEGGSKKPKEEGKAKEEEFIPPEVPEEESPFKLGETTEGPVGWESLKEAIKEDHKVTEEEIAKEAPPTEVLEEQVKEEEPVEGEVIEPVKEEKVEEQKEEIATKLAETMRPGEDEAERKEIIRIIFKYGIGGCLVILIIIGVLFFQLPQRIYNFTVNLFAGEEVIQQVDEDKIAVVKDEEIKVPSGLETAFLTGEEKVKTRERFEPGVRTSIISGESIPLIRRISPGIRTGYIFGLPESPEKMFDRIASYMNMLTRLQNAFATDIHQLLDRTQNREQELEFHLRELRDLHTEAEFTVEEVNEEKDELKIKFNEVTAEKDALEEAFFSATEKLEGNKANEILNEFIDVSQEQIDLRAEFNALDKLSEFFDVAIRNMDARIRDIQFNKKALIEGVRVVDIKGSDLELIIEEAEL